MAIFWLYLDPKKLYIFPNKKLGLPLDVGIEDLGIELGSMSNQPDICIRFQYQSYCLDVDEIARWNQRSW
jgi:hypothetical protein